MELNRSLSPAPSNDTLVVSGSFTPGGTLNVSNIGPTLSVSNKFKLFASAVSGFASVNLPAGYTWQNDLAVDGSIMVLTVSAVAPPYFPPGAVTRLPDGNISLTATGAIGSTYKLWASTNVAATPITNLWTLLSSGSVTTSPFTVQDLTATNYARRFYLFSAP
jgi:hypothetical protein